MFFFNDRSVFLVSGTSQFCTYPSTRAVFLPTLQHHDKVATRRMLNAFDTQNFERLMVFYMITQPASNLLFQSANIFRFPVLSIFKSDFNLFSRTLSWHILIFVYFCFLSFFQVYIDLVRLFIPQTPRIKFMYENIQAVE